MPSTDADAGTVRLMTEAGHWCILGQGQNATHSAYYHHIRYFCGLSPVQIEKTQPIKVFLTGVVVDYRSLGTLISKNVFRKY
jgi:hypothetical protein